jgi:hypothetical protein
VDTAQRDRWTHDSKERQCPRSNSARELAYAGRVVWRSPGLSLLSVVTMGVGIGVSAVLANLTAGVDRAGAASGNIDDWRRRSTSSARVRRG